MCSPSHVNKAVCDLTDQRNVPFLPQFPPPEYQYFPNPYLGPIMVQANYCPVPFLEPSPSKISCNDDTIQPSTPGEKFGMNSKCFDVLLQDSSSNLISSSACFEAFCNEELHLVEISIDGTQFSCDHDGQQHEYAPHSYLKCPRVAAICPNMICPASCSGKGTCEWSGKNSKCICLDKTNTSAGCFG